MSWLPHAYAIEMMTALITIGTLGLSVWNLSEAYWDWTAERRARTSNTALTRTRGDLRTEIAQLAQVTMLVWLAMRSVHVIPPDVADLWLDPEQFNQGRIIFLTFALLKATGRYLERRTRLEVREEYRREFVDANRTWKWVNQEPKEQ